MALGVAMQRRRKLRIPRRKKRGVRKWKRVRKVKYGMRKRRKSFRTGRVVTPRALGMLFPLKLKFPFQYCKISGVTCRTTDKFQICVENASNANCVWRTNSIFDPFLTGLPFSSYNTTTSPYTFFSKYYDSYEVISTKFEVEAFPQSHIDAGDAAAMRNCFGIYISDVGTSLGYHTPSVEEALIMPGWTVKEYSLDAALIAAPTVYKAYPSNQICRMKRYWNKRNLSSNLGTHTANDFGGSPSLTQYFILAHAGISALNDPVSPHNARVRVSMRMMTILSNRKDIDEQAEMRED